MAFRFEIDTPFKRRLGPGSPIELVDGPVQGRVIYRANMFDAPDGPTVAVMIDPALGYFHPNMDRWQGIWLNDRHLCSMDRGPVVPEFHVWKVVKDPDGSKRISHIERCGWRHTFKRLVDKGVPNVTWENLNKVFGVDYKVYVGPKTLDGD